MVSDLYDPVPVQVAIECIFDERARGWKNGRKARDIKSISGAEGDHEGFKLVALVPLKKAASKSAKKKNGKKLSSNEDDLRGLSEDSCNQVPLKRSSSLPTSASSETSPANNLQPTGRNKAKEAVKANGLDTISTSASKKAVKAANGLDTISTTSASNTSRSSKEEKMGEAPKLQASKKMERSLGSILKKLKSKMSRPIAEEETKEVKEAREEEAVQREDKGKESAPRAAPDETPPKPIKEAGKPPKAPKSTKSPKLVNRAVELLPTEDGIDHRMQREDKGKESAPRAEPDETPPKPIKEAGKPPKAPKSPKSTKSPKLVNRAVELLPTEDGIDHRMPLDMAKSSSNVSTKSTRSRKPPKSPKSTKSRRLVNRAVELLPTEDGIDHRMPLEMVKSSSNVSTKSTTSNISRVSRGLKGSSGSPGRAGAADDDKSVCSTKSPQAAPGTTAATSKDVKSPDAPQGTPPATTEDTRPTNAAKSSVTEDEKEKPVAFESSSDSESQAGSQVKSQSAQKINDFNASDASEAAIASSSTKSESTMSHSSSTLSASTFSASTWSTWGDFEDLSYASLGGEGVTYESLRGDDLSCGSIRGEEESVRTIFAGLYREARKDPWKLVSREVFRAQEEVSDSLKHPWTTRWQ